MFLAPEHAVNRLRSWASGGTADGLVTLSAGLALATRAVAAADPRGLPGGGHPGTEMASGFRYRLIDTAGSELEIIEWPEASVNVGDTVCLGDGRTVPVVDVYDDEYGREGGVQATLAVDDE